MQDLLATRNLTQIGHGAVPTDWATGSVRRAYCTPSGIAGAGGGLTGESSLHVSRVFPEWDVFHSIIASNLYRKPILRGRFYQFSYSFALWEERKYFVNYIVEILEEGSST